MSLPRLRMLAGPNGSGKPSLLRSLRDQYRLPLGLNLNADEIDATLTRTGRFAFGPWQVSTDSADLQAFCGSHPLGSRIEPNSLLVLDNELAYPAGQPVGYLAAVLADFLRRRWVAARQSLTYKTVVSSADKVVLLESARASGYRTYTYFVCTDNPALNVSRVAYRVTQGGHHVPADKIVTRYVRSLARLPARSPPATGRTLGKIPNENTLPSPSTSRTAWL